jgi:hypothetical protein
MTRNEIRAKEDLAPMPGGDSLTVQSNLIPIEKLGQTPAAQGLPLKPVEKPQNDTQLPPSMADANKNLLAGILETKEVVGSRGRMDPQDLKILAGEIVEAMQSRVPRSGAPEMYMVQSDTDKISGSRKFKRLEITK